ncbi:MAG: helix-turn-helix domain-containing protein [Methylococcaceae bacterium]
MVTKNRVLNMATCPKCDSQACIKDGVIKEKQRFKCKECGYRHTVTQRGLGLDIRRQALQLYLAGLGFRSIGRLLQCSHVTVSQWINAHGASIKSIRANEVNIIQFCSINAYVDACPGTKNATILLIDAKENCTILSIPVMPKQQKISTKS